MWRTVSFCDFSVYPSCQGEQKKKKTGTHLSYCCFLPSYKTMINWASLVLLLCSVVILTTQANCVKSAPGLFYLVLVFSLVGYACLAMLVFLWLIVMFCLNGLVFLFEIFGVGPTVMQWQGATPEMLDAIPVIKFTKKPSSFSPGPAPLANATPCGNDGATAEKGPEKGPAGASLPFSETTIWTTTPTAPVIVVSQEGEESLQSGLAGTSRSTDVVINMNALAIDHNRGDDSSSGSEAAGPHTTWPSVTTPLPQQHQQYLSKEDEALALDELDPEVTSVNKPPLAHEHKHEGEEESEVVTACSICLCDYEDQEDLRRLPCDHYFHKECVDEWLKLKRTCPLCKRDITNSGPMRFKKNWRRRRNNRSRPGLGSSSSSHHH